MALAMLGVGVLGLRWLDQRVFGSSEPGALVTVTIPSGTSSPGIGQILAKAGVVSSSATFALRAQGESKAFLPGTYQLHRNERSSVLFAALEAGPPPRPTVRFVVPEGFSIRDIAAKATRLGLRSDDVLAAAKAAKPPAGVLAKGEHAASVEGFLFPATYDVAKPASARELVAQQLAAFPGYFAKVDLRYARSRNLSAYDVLKIASMVEREAGAPADRAKIAAVIYNRLHRHMPLGIDATIQYAVGSWRTLTAADLRIDSPYNSRTHKGLPPTPICNPGLDSLRAAARPAKVAYLYYLAIPHDPRGRSVFFTTQAAFLQYQREHPG